MDSSPSRRGRLGTWAAVAVVGLVITATAVGSQRFLAGSPTPTETYTVGSAEFVECANPESPMRCGRVSLEASLSDASVEFTVDGAGGELLLWLPGGPNGFATAAYAAGRERVLAAYPERRVVVLDPPRSERPDGDKSWALGNCLTADVQNAFYAALLDSSGEVEQRAREFAEACAGHPALAYSSAVHAEVLGRVVELLAATGESRGAPAAYVASADVHMLGALADAGVSISRAIVDSPVPMTTSGLAFVENGAESMAAALDRLLSSADNTLAQSLELAESDEAAYILTLMRVPGLTTSERAELLRNRSGEEVLEVADQYFRRYGDGEFSPLNGLFYSGLCSQYNWPNHAEYLAARGDAEREAGSTREIVRFIFNYYLPCLEWRGHRVDAVNIGQVDQVVVLGSRMDPVVGSEPAGRWASALDASNVFLSESPGHAGLLASLPCTDVELFGIDDAGDDCIEAVADEVDHA